MRAHARRHHRADVAGRKMLPRWYDSGCFVLEGECLIGKDRLPAPPGHYLIPGDAGVQSGRNPDELP